MTPEEMLRTLAPRRPPDCPSDLALDRARAGEAGDAEGARLRRHVAGCPRCKALGQATDEAAHALPARRIDGEPRPVSAAPRTPRIERRAPWLRLAGARGRAAALALAAAAAGWIVWAHVGSGPVASSSDGGHRSKGGPRLGLFVKSGDRVRQGADGEVVAPGDTLRFAVTATTSRWVAVLSRDGAGTASLYVPAGGSATPMIAVTAGHDVPLPGGFMLDEALGRRIWWACSAISRCPTGTCCAT